MTSTPGAVMSGLSRSPPPARAGPYDENAGHRRVRGPGSGRTAEIVAVGLGVAAYALIAAPATLSTCTAGTEVEVSVERLPGVGLERTMPTPPAFLTATLLSTRALSPRGRTTRSFR